MPKEEDYEETALEAVLWQLSVLYDVDLHSQGLGPLSAQRLAENIATLRAERRQRICTVNVADNFIGVEGARKIAASLLLPPLEVAASGPGSSPDAVPAAAAALEDANAPGDAAGEVALSLDLGWNRLGPDGAEAVAAAMRGSSRALGSLELDCNDIGDQGLRCLLDALPRTPSLKVLKLGGNRLSGAAGALLAAALRLQAATPDASDGLEELDVSRNFLGARGASALAAALATRPRPKLKRLRLDVNRIGDEGAAAFAAALRSSASSDGGGTSSSSSSTCRLEAGVSGDSAPVAANGSCAVAADCAADSAADGAAEGDEGGLEELDLSANRVRDVGAAALAEALAAGAGRLWRLALRHNELTDAGTGALARAAATGRSPSLRSVELAGNGNATGASRQDVAMAVLRSSGSIVLYDPLRAATSLCLSGAYRVDISGVCMGCEHAERLGKAMIGPRVRFRAFVASDAGIGDRSATLLMPALLRRAKQLEELNLSWNGLRVDGARAVASLLAVRPCGLEILDLECNSLGDGGVQALAEAILGASAGTQAADEALTSADAANASADVADAAEAADLPLKALRLAGNLVGATGASHLAAALPRLPYLAELDLSRNRLGPGGAKALSSAFTAGHLRARRRDLFVGLAVNRLGDRGAEALAASLTSPSPQAVMDSRFDDRGRVVSHGRLRLALGSNLIGDAGATALAGALAAGAPLAELRLDRNKVTSTGSEAFVEAFRTALLVSSSGPADAERGRKPPELPVVDLAENPIEAWAELSLQAAISEATSAAEASCVSEAA
eukprot:TRINITY_DN72350_c0_g1_i1.p1 TRINITY_DN72350_c0_g1~~TRINITY_DN72350_c0_g1_i1.p1  ORF type:complete len:793 (-),score=213.21 TRINITY_DN72350_c0_g1_i1:44-2422(-)